MNSLPVRLLVVAALIWCIVVPARAGDAEARIERHVHNGVASCATSVCHGKLKIQENENVWLNEYRVWSSEDRHSQAYRTLGNDESKRIAAKLALKSARTAKICLNCHADNVPKNKRGRKFQISDGVGCEACHGGSEKWIKSHAEKTATHERNVAAGLYPTEKIDDRADLCLGCHLGTKNRFATHVIMGAGHPRLSFELETFTANQPAHYTVDDDYVKRKGRPSPWNAWLYGQIAGAQRYVSLLQTGLFRGKGLFPELAMYDCHGCHHPMDDIRWSRRRTGGTVEPGTLRLQRHHFVGVEAAAKVLESDKSAAEFRALVDALLKAGQASIAEVEKAAARLEDWLDARREKWRGSRKSTGKIRRELLNLAAADRASDFSAAEQIFLSVEALSYVLEDIDKRESELDRLFKTVEDDRKFSPSRFAGVAKAIRGRF